MRYRVLVTTSGLGSRLGDFTKYTNKSLIRIREKPVISYVIECYPKNTEFVITLGYYGDHVKQFLEIAYPDIKFIFVEIDKYKGEGSSLLYSMLKAKKHLQMPFVFHAADTLVFEKIPLPSRNWSGGYRGTNSAQYRSFDVIDGVIEKIYDKGMINPDLLHIGLVGIKDFKKFWKEAKDIYKKNKDNQSLSDVVVIERLIKKGVKFSAEEFKDWSDAGNVQSLFETWSKFDDLSRVMDKVGEATFIINGFVIKFFSNENKLQERVERAILLKNYVPKISRHTKNFLKYKFVNGNLLASNIVPEDFKNYLNWLQHKFWIDVRISNKTIFFNDCKKFYLDKTNERIKTFFVNRNMVDREDIINGTKIPKISTILNKIDFDYLSEGLPSRFHGDLVLDNVIRSGNNFILLDWRENFAGNLSIGDRYYDLAKLNHNLSVNHDIVNKELFTIRIKRTEIFCDILRPSRLVECQKYFFEFVKQYNYDSKKIKILTSLIWLNMSPLHQHPFDLFLFYFGKYNLWKAVNEKE